MANRGLSQKPQNKEAKVKENTSDMPIFSTRRRRFDSNANCTDQEEMNNTESILTFAIPHAIFNSPTNPQHSPPSLSEKGLHLPPN
jgi:hypothetical protein